MENDRPKLVPAGEFIVGMLVVTGIVRPEDAERATAIVEEEVKVWLAIKSLHDRHNSN